MIYIKSDEHIAKMQIAGQISKEILLSALRFAIAGVSLREIDAYIESQMNKNGVVAWFKEVDGYKYASCISVNEVLVHGIPSDYKLKQDDLVSIDIGVKYKDAYVDNCWTNIVGNEIGDKFPRKFPDTHKYARFLGTGVKALYESIERIREGARIGCISNTMQMVIESEKFNVIRDYTGHGVGYAPHEDPYIPCLGNSNSGAIIKRNMVFAVEVMYTYGGFALTIDKNDGWTAKTADNSMSAMFEHTVLALKDGYRILTD